MYSFQILSAFLACAAAAPSGLLAPVVVPALAYTAVLPTISPGDIQAAAIDAQVKVQDQAIAAVDKARELSELAVDNINEKAFSSNDQVKEKVEEQFWSAEEKKWQALDALKTAEAQIDGSVARNADVLSQNAIRPYLAVVPVAVAPVAPIAPVAFTPGIVAPVLKTATEEVKEVKEENAEAVVKSAETPEEAKDSVAVEATEAKLAETNSLEAKPLVASVITAPLLTEQYRYTIGAPIVPPVLQYTAAVPYGVQTIGLSPQSIVAPGLAPTVYNTPVYNTVW